MEAHALRANIPRVSFTPCLQSENGALHTRPPSLLIVPFSLFLFPYFAAVVMVIFIAIDPLINPFITLLQVYMNTAAATVVVDRGFSPDKREQGE
jgi:hypothetical protein